MILQKYSNMHICCSRNISSSTLKTVLLPLYLWKPQSFFSWSFQKKTKKKQYKLEIYFLCFRNRHSLSSWTSHISLSLSVILMLVQASAYHSSCQRKVRKIDCYLRLSGIFLWVISGTLQQLILMKWLLRSSQETVAGMQKEERSGEYDSK